MIIEVIDTGEIRFLDTVESKLMRHVDKMADGKIKQDIRLYHGDHSPYANHSLCCPIDVSRLKEVPKYEKISTNSYYLTFQMNNALDTGFLIGFPRIYVSSTDTWEGKFTIEKELKYDVIYEVPIKDYSAFLSDKEMTELKSIIRSLFIKYVSDFNSSDIQAQYNFKYGGSLRYPYYPCYDSMSSRIVRISSADSLMPQFSLSEWAHTLKDLAEYGRIRVYSDSLCKRPINRDQVYLKIAKQDTLRNPDKTIMLAGETMSLKSLSVCESWSFADSKDNSNRLLYDEKVTRKILSIGIDLFYFNSWGISTYYTTVWFKYKDILTVGCLNDGKRALYKDVLDALLYKRMGIGHDYSY